MKRNLLVCHSDILDVVRVFDVDTFHTLDPALGFKPMAAKVVAESGDYSNVRDRLVNFEWPESPLNEAPTGSYGAGGTSIEGSPVNGAVATSAEPSKPSSSPANQGSDDLTLLPDVGPAAETAMNAKGLRTFDQIAQASVATLASIRGISERGAKAIKAKAAELAER